MFQFTPFPSLSYVFTQRYIRIAVCGFPHSDICGSMDMCSSPQLFAAYHVLLRLPVPRHPPDALLNLTNQDLRRVSAGFFTYYCQSVNFLVSLNKFSMNRYPLFLALLDSLSNLLNYLVCYSIFKVLRKPDRSGLQNGGE